MKKILIILSVFLFNLGIANDATTESCRKILNINKSLVLSFSEDIGQERMESFHNELKMITNRDQLVSLSNRYFSPEKAEAFTQGCEKIILELKALKESNASSDDIKNGISIVIDEEPIAPCRNQLAYNDCMITVNVGLGLQSLGAVGLGLEAAGMWASMTGEPYSTAIVGAGVALVGLWHAVQDFAEKQENCYKKHCVGTTGGPGMPSGGIPKTDNTPH